MIWVKTECLLLDNFGTISSFQQQNDDLAIRKSVIIYMCIIFTGLDMLILQCIVCRF